MDECKYRIPREILDTIFVKRTQRWRQVPASLDEQILSLVIRPRVLVDCNLVGGAEAIIALNRAPMERVEDFVNVYRIPKTLTQNRSIMSVLNVTFYDPSKASTYGTASVSHNTAMMQAGNAMVDAMGSIPVTSTARVQLIGENVVMVRDIAALPQNIYLRCILENDENMAHLQLRSYRAFSDLVVLAVKSYIYNNYSIMLDMGELMGGQQIGKFKDIIDGYADSEELYQTFLTEKWQKVAFQNDREQHSRFLRNLLGGNR